MLERQLGDVIHPYICHLALGREGYKEAVRAFSIHNSSHIAESYWIKALKWSNELVSQINNIVRYAKDVIKQKLLLINLSQIELELLDFLWQQPIISQNTIVTHIGLSANNARVLIEKLQRLGILQMRKLRSPVNSIVYDSPEIILAHSQVEHVIFNYKK